MVDDDRKQVKTINEVLLPNISLCESIESMHIPLVRVEENLNINSFPKFDNINPGHHSRKEFIKDISSDSNPISNYDNFGHNNQALNHFEPHSPERLSESKIITESEIQALIKDINILREFDDDQKIERSFSIMDDDYLKQCNNTCTNEEFELCLKSLDKDDMLNLKRQIDLLKFEVPSDKLDNCNIGPISTLDYLVETSFGSDEQRKRSIMEKLISLDDSIFRWRRVGGDGNCYYRGVIFAYVEKIILECNLPLVKFLIVDVMKSHLDPYMKDLLEQNSLKGELLVKILVLIYYALTVNNKTNDNIQRAYCVYLKCFNKCKHFDYGLIFYFRYKLYDYIKQNEQKLYTKEFSVKIGNLLPNEYETEKGEFLYSNFYKDFLMKLFRDAEKIVIYLTPFVLGVKLKILTYDFGKNQVDKLKEFAPKQMSNEKVDHITVLYKKGHYDLIYTEEHFNKLSRFLCDYVNLYEDFKVINKEMQNEIFEIKKKKAQLLTQAVLENKNYNECIDINKIPEDIGLREKFKFCSSCKKIVQKKNIFSYCNPCLTDEVKSSIMSKFFVFLPSSKANCVDKGNASESVKTFKSVFYDSKIKIKDISIDIKEAVKCISSDDTLEQIILDIKSTMCVICENGIDPKQSLIFFKMPCGCNLCGQKCVKIYFEILTKESEGIKDFPCLCGTMYNLSDLKYVILFCYSNNLNKAKEMLTKIFLNTIKTHCMKCLSEISYSNRNTFLEISDMEMEKYIKINKGQHNVCSMCLFSGPFYIGSSIFCLICNSFHKIKTIK